MFVLDADPVNRKNEESEEQNEARMH